MALDILNDAMVAPDPLIEELGAAIHSLPEACGPDTIVRSVVCARTALWYLGRNGPLVTNKDRLRADLFIDMLVDAVTRSSSGRDIKMVFWSKSPHTSVYTFDKPFGFLDGRIASAFDFSLIVKEYFTSRGDPDIFKVMAVGKLYKALYAQRKASPSFPHCEITARTMRRIISRRSGKLLAFEHTAPDGELRSTARAVADAASSLVSYCDKHYGGAPVDSYAEKTMRRASRLLPFLPLESRSLLRRTLRRDAAAIAQHLENAVLLPHVDPTSKNIVLERDGSLRFIDLEKVLELRVNAQHLFAHVWFDPVYPFSFDERAGLLGEKGLPAAGYYLLSRVSRALDGRLRSPFVQWDEAVRKRFDGYVGLLCQVSSNLANEYGLFDALRHIDAGGIAGEFLQVQNHRHS